MHQHNYIRGMRQGIPVGLGYFVVSFTIGIAARKADLTPVQAAVMSFTNNTSAGQFASFALIASGAPYLEMAISQAVINLRYCLMSCAHIPEGEAGPLVYLRRHERGDSRMVPWDAGWGAVHGSASPDIFKCHEYGAVRHVHRDLYARGQGG